jgi:hypothetical protein
MNPVQQTVSGIVGPDSVVHLMNTDVDVNAGSTNPEEIREEMWVRATKSDGATNLKIETTLKLQKLFGVRFLCNFWLLRIEWENNQGNLSFSGPIP